MRIESNLCHISEHKAIVRVKGWIGNKTLGSALGEGPTVESAENNAIFRLNQRISDSKNNNEPNHLNDIDNIRINSIDNRKENINLSDKNSTNNNSSKQIKSDNLNQDKQPSDWSSELTEINEEIRRLKWSRDEETKFLEKHFGYNNRYKITTYNELKKYLKELKSIQLNQSDSLTVNSNENLIAVSDKILKELTWDHQRGREYLQNEFNVTSRHDLNHEQLVNFVEKLRLIKNNLAI